MSVSQQKYSAIMVRLHWLTVLLMIAIYASIELRGMFERGSPGRDLMKEMHFVLGLTLGLITLARLLIRRFSLIPAIEPAPSVWSMRLAAVMHGALYLLLLVMPLLGYLVLSAGDKVIPFWGLQLPALIAPDPDWASSLKELHELLGSIGYWLIGLHAVAALAHHYVLKDNTLKRMLPGATPPKS